MAEVSTDARIAIENPQPSEGLQFQLITKDIVKQNFDYDPQDWHSKRYTVNFEEAKKLLQDPKASRQPSPLMFSEEQIKTEGKRNFKKVVKAFVDHGDIPTTLAVQIGRLVKPSDVLVHNEAFARFLFMDDKFPESPEKRADLEIGTEYINGWAFKEMKESTIDAGLNLGDQEIFQLVLRNGISHEYGHAVERVIRLLRQESIPESDDAWKEKLELADGIEQSVYDEIAPSTELQQLLEGQPTEGYAVERRRTTSERIAVGFETLGTRYALEEMGIDKDTIEKVMTNLDRSDKAKLDESIELMKLLSRNGLTIQDFADARLDIYGYLRDQGEEDLYEPLSWGLDTRLLGYYFPLNQEELKKFISEQLPGNAVQSLPKM